MARPNINWLRIETSRHDIEENFFLESPANSTAIPKTYGTRVLLDIHPGEEEFAVINVPIPEGEKFLIITLKAEKAAVYAFSKAGFSYNNEAGTTTNSSSSFPNILHEGEHIYITNIPPKVDDQRPISYHVFFGHPSQVTKVYDFDRLTCQAIDTDACDPTHDHYYCPDDPELFSEMQNIRKVASIQIWHVKYKGGCSKYKKLYKQIRSSMAYENPLEHTRQLRERLQAEIEANIVREKEAPAPSEPVPTIMQLGVELFGYDLVQLVRRDLNCIRILQFVLVLAVYVLYPYTTTCIMLLYYIHSHYDLQVQDYTPIIDK